MVYLKKITLFICILTALNTGIEGIFEIDFLQRTLVHFPVITHFFKVIALFAGAYQILILALPE